MRKHNIFAVSLTLLLLLSTSLSTVGSPEQPQPVNVIVGFKDKPLADLVKKHGGNVTHIYTLIPAVAARVPKPAIDELKKLEEVAYVEPDDEVHMLVQTLPWGVDRIDAEIVHFTDNKGTGVKVSILDTGIDYTHPDLDANYKGGYDFVNDDADPKDDNGHGTHVAGIVAAEDNDIGVIGVAPEAYLYAVKVLNRFGSGYLSDVILGIQWSVDNHMQIISMSLGTATYSASLEDACNSAYGAGLVLVAAAGNSGDGDPTTDEYSYPAAYASVIAVGATDKFDTAPSWSNSGPYLELAAPGVSIYSTLPTYRVTLTRSYGYDYGTLSGTSMSCPHVTGVVALVFTTAVDPAYDLDSDKIWDAGEVRKKLQDTADDLGPSGKDKLYGYGLVDADGAAQVEWFRGNYITPWPYGYDSTEADTVLLDLVNVHSSYVALNIYVYQDTWDSNNVYLETDQDETLTHIIGDIHGSGLKASLTVFLLVKDGTWRGEIGPGDVSAWFLSYRTAVNHYAGLAEANGVELFVIGSELETLKSYKVEWTTIISQVRDRYSGRISYNQNWWYSDSEYNAVLACDWFKGLDYIGISGFFELTTENDPSLAELVAAWSNDAHGRNPMADLKNLVYTFKRLVVFTEIGYRSIDGANKHPWDYTTDAAVDLQEQADCYEALFQVFHDKPWFRGTLFWAWSTNPAEGGSADKGYVVRDKPAETVLSDWYAKIKS